MISVADVVVEALRARGVTMMFGVPGGGTNLDLIEAGERAGIRFVLAHSETAALFMASTYGEMTGRPGVGLCTLGPGVANSANGLAHAFLDRTPVLLISDRYPDGHVGVVTHQTLDHAAVVGPLTKWTGTLRQGDARSVIERAIREACAEPAGPVHLDFPQGEDSASPEEAARDAPESPLRKIDPITASSELVGRVRTLTGSAKRPLIIAGIETRHEATAVARALGPILNAGVPVLTTYKAKGIVPETSEWWGGIFTNAAAEEPLVHQADLIVLVGVDPVELIPRSWTYQTQVISLRRTPSDSRYVVPDIELVTELGPGLERISSGTVWRPTWSAGVLLEHRRSLVGRLRSPVAGLQPADVIENAWALAPDDAIATVDSGAHMFLATELWTATQPGRFLISNGLATMGYALPAAIAAALVAPDTTVVCFTGDGGLFMQIGELETAARLQSRIVVVVLDDTGFSLIRVKQTRKGYGTAGVDFGASRLDRVAEALGVPARTASTVPEFREAMRWALSVDGPVLICARIDATVYDDMFAAIRG